MINVSYHIAQYTNIISDLRCEIERLKKKIAEQASRQLNSDRADIRNVQGKVSHSQLTLIFEKYLLFELFESNLHPFPCSRGPGPLQPAESRGDGSVEGAASGCLPPTDADQEEPDGAGKQQHGDPDCHL